MFASWMKSRRERRWGPCIHALYAHSSSTRGPVAARYLSLAERKAKPQQVVYVGYRIAAVTNWATGVCKTISGGRPLAGHGGVPLSATSSSARISPRGSVTAHGGMGARARRRRFSFLVSRMVASSSLTGS